MGQDLGPDWGPEPLYYEGFRHRDGTGNVVTLGQRYQSGLGPDWDPDCGRIRAWSGFRLGQDWGLDWARIGACIGTRLGPRASLDWARIGTRIGARIGTQIEARSLCGKKDPGLVMKLAMLFF